MIQSMTGYGKAETISSNKKYTVEIRSLNGKTADISIKSQYIPRKIEYDVRQLLSKTLIRGNIDLFATVENTKGAETKLINKDVLLDYYNQIRELQTNTVLSNCNGDDLLSTLLRLPDVIETKKEEVTEETIDSFKKCINSALDSIVEFRIKEGAILKEDISSRAKLIESYVFEVEKYENERVEIIKERLRSKIDEINGSPDRNRLEQEIIYYIEKLDINEEKVRLRQHCKYFIETIDTEEFPGRKLGFIAQEMGREINTMGSKANHSEIQKWVVRMKDELEKIKEQSLNIL